MAVPVTAVELKRLTKLCIRNGESWVTTHRIGKYVSDRLDKEWDFTSSILFAENPDDGCILLCRNNIVKFGLDGCIYHRLPRPSGFDQEKSLEIYFVLVDELSRGRGVFTAMLNQLISIADQSNTTLWIEIVNPSLKEMWINKGFIPNKTQPPTSSVSFFMHRLPTPKTNRLQMVAKLL